MEVLKLEIFIKDETENSIFFGAQKVLEKLRPTWDSKLIKYKMLTDGITNKLVKCSFLHLAGENACDDAVLIRVYGNKTDLLIDRKSETRNIEMLNKFALAPKLFATFANGLAYEFVPGCTLSTTTVRQPHIFNLVARQMAKLHKVPSFTTTKPKTAMLWTKLDSFLKLVPDTFTKEHIQTQFAEMKLTKQQLSLECTEIKACLESSSSPLVFCHNDLLLGNVICSGEDEFNGGNACLVTFIDFEYADWNYQAYDIGNHFAEFAGVDNVDYAKYPCKDLQMQWLRAYASEFYGENNYTDAHLSELYVQVNKFVVASHLLWGLWALIQAENSHIDFDFIKSCCMQLDRNGILSQSASVPESEHKQLFRLSNFTSAAEKKASIAKMMHDIIKSPSFNVPPEEDQWMSIWDITFPSDVSFQDRMYKKMLDRQKQRKLQQKITSKDDEIEIQINSYTNMQFSASRTSLHRMQPENEVLHDWNILPAKTKVVPFHAPQAKRMVKPLPLGKCPIRWTVEDISLAGRLLSDPPLPVVFKDDQEMRRVYTLIYDVLRYKNILNQALHDVYFFIEHRELLAKTTLVWLLLFDLYHRSFKKRSTANHILAEHLFPDAGLTDIEQILWKDRVKLAAEFARIRIKNKALRLSQLLPHHLRDSRTGIEHIEPPLTCWANTWKVKSIADLAESIKRVLNVQLIDENINLMVNSFKWDTHCPHFIVFHPSVREKLAQCTLVKKHKLIIQDKSFCLGPATFVKLITDMQLTGSVIQSHVNSPRTTAYLASILSQNDNIKKLLAFSAGTRKDEYESYFSDLGIKNIAIFAEKMIDLPPDSDNLEEVIAVFATPPNSYSAVADPIDLVCSRGGDLAMLEILTETEDTPEGRKRVATILDEQKQTLKYAMSRPQIQFVLYETHSEIAAENNEMVKKAVNEINKYAQIHHAILQGKIKGYQVPKNFQEMSEDSSVEMSPPVYVISEDKRRKALKEVVVPETDMFDMPLLPDLCLNNDGCLTPKDKGCFLALVQRKQVTRLDNKYMIQMAENRGVFGSDSNKKSQKAQKTRMDESANLNSPVNIPKRRERDFEMNPQLNIKRPYTHKGVGVEGCEFESVRAKRVNYMCRKNLEKFKNDRINRPINRVEVPTQIINLPPINIREESSGKARPTMYPYWKTNSRVIEQRRS